MEINHGPRRPVPVVCRILCRNVRGLSGDLSDITMASSQFDILLCSETLVSICVTCQSSWFLDLVALEPVGWLYMCENDLELFVNPNLSVAVAKCWFLGFAV